MAEKEGWRDGEEKKTEKGMRSGGEESCTSGNNAYWGKKWRARTEKQWGRKEKMVGARRQEWVMQKKDEGGRGNRGRERERRCECP